MPKKFWLSIFLLLNLTSQAQFAKPEEEYAEQFNLISEVKKFLTDSVKLQLGSTFYSNQTIKDSAYYYLYYTPKIEDTSKSQLPFELCDSFLEATSISDSLESKYFTHIYKTAANSHAKITFLFLSYPPEAIIYCMIHEAMHHFVEDHCKMPYKMNESFCDAIALKLTSLFYKYHPELNQEAQKFQTEIIENTYSEINELVQNSKSSKYDFDDGSKKLSVQLTPYWKQSPFLNDRYNYSINKAYLKRVRFYSGYYFLFKTVIMGTSVNALNQRLGSLCNPETINQIMVVGEVTSGN